MIFHIGIFFCYLCSLRTVHHVTAFYSRLSYFLVGCVVSAFHGSCDPGGAPAQRSVSMLNVPSWTALYSGWASACLSLSCMWGTRHVVGALILQFATTCEDSMPCRAVVIRRMKSGCPANQSLEYGNSSHCSYYGHIKTSFVLSIYHLSILFCRSIVLAFIYQSIVLLFFFLLILSTYLFLKALKD